MTAVLMSLVYRHQHYSVHAPLRSTKRNSSSKSLTYQKDNYFYFELPTWHLRQYAAWIELFVCIVADLMFYKGKKITIKYMHIQQKGASDCGLFLKEKPSDMVTIVLWSCVLFNHPNMV